MKALMEVVVEEHSEGRFVLRVDNHYGDPCIPVAEEKVSFPDLPAALEALRKDGQGLTLAQEVALSHALALPRVAAP